MEILDGIAPVADRYDGFVLDLWGVVHDGRRPYPGVPEALGELKARGKRVVFLTNAPRRSWAVQGLLDGMGLDRALYDGIMSSGEDALVKIRAGASLVQLYTGFALAGPALVPRLKRDLAAALRREGFASVAGAVGTGA